ncbi:ADP-ribose pyrophosphatase YjhB (NUDIX family) [Paenibacillus phyllosphaerae]|uniref:ADP-ribose pyrophosphatase YjhB (NUDIX family) n=1 Tax=Paenibacillus phyllosphaerae TaxID=274593 RepID=A0A7W5FNH5_9BACL|nr:NUDIX domain-containing protein [Paenibacillus phyllosphaerae]MBB3111147.1 ADP-ribose pyrophosphatase YjhB (NUDIX family) [Paenibacillus phyllosphaerae]
MTIHDERDRNGLTESEFLESYDVSNYDRPSVTVDMLIFTVMDKEQENFRKLPEKSLQLLLIKRGEHPYLGQWALPGGFVAPHESLDEGAARELYSETNIRDIYMEQLYTWGDVGRDPRTRVISCSYLALVDRTALQVQAGDDADDAQWFEVGYRVLQEKKTNLAEGWELEKIVQLTLTHGSTRLTATVKLVETISDRKSVLRREIVESKGIGFDHAKIIEYAIGRLRNKIEYTDIAFYLMPHLFTLTALQQVYEVILGKELLAAAFRRKIAPMVLETNELTKDAGHRPSKLYRFDPNWNRTF